MRALVSRSKAPATTSLPLWWDIVAAYGGGAGAGAGRDEGFRRLSVDLQVCMCLRSPHPFFVFFSLFVVL